MSGALPPVNGEPKYTWKECCAKLKTVPFVPGFVRQEEAQELGWEIDQLRMEVSRKREVFGFAVVQPLAGVLAER